MQPQSLAADQILNAFGAIAFRMAFVCLQMEYVAVHDGRLPFMPAITPSCQDSPFAHGTKGCAARGKLGDRHDFISHNGEQFMRQAIRHLDVRARTRGLFDFTSEVAAFVSDLPYAFFP